MNKNILTRIRARFGYTGNEKGRNDTDAKKPEEVSESVGNDANCGKIKGADFWKNERERRNRGTGHGVQK